MCHKGETNFELADRILQSLVSEHKVPGLAVCVSDEENILFCKGYGFSNIKKRIKVHPNQSIFRIASVSKPIASLVLAVAVQEGWIDLNRSIFDYVPDYPKKEFDFTIKQLASHTAGIRGYRGKEYGLNRDMSIKASLDLFKDDPLQFVPGTSFLYNSFGWVLLSLALEEASAVSFSQLVKTKVLDPLEMKHTFPDNPSISIQNMVSFYTLRASIFKKSIPVNNSYKLAAGGYVSTVTDINKLGLEVLHPTLVSKDTMDLFTSSQYIGEKPTFYGLGWQASMDSKNRPFCGHKGSGVGGYSNFFVYPLEKKVITILINCTDPKVQKQLDIAIDNFIR